MLGIASRKQASADVRAIEASRVDLRLKGVFAAELGFVRRVLRSYRVPERDVDDAVQQVFIVLSRKLARVTPGRERGFLYLTALNVAAHARRARARRREALGYVPEKLVEETLTEELIDGRRVSARLMDRLERMDAGAREVFVLHDVGHRTMEEIATALALPRGTVASRLRRARAALLSEYARAPSVGLPAV